MSPSKYRYHLVGEEQHQLHMTLPLSFTTFINLEMRVPRSLDPVRFGWRPSVFNNFSQIVGLGVPFLFVDELK